ncbi:hypothetical protein INR49_028149 [Caranx melampygus]|nr:hypothetical protein INR49_028149 [Caranx melampygus]
MHTGGRRGSTGEADYDFIVAEKASCLGCPEEIYEYSEDLQVPLFVSIAKYNSISDSTHLFTLNTITTPPDRWSQVSGSSCSPGPSSPLVSTQNILYRVPTTAASPPASQAPSKAATKEDHLRRTLRRRQTFRRPNRGLGA